MTGCEVLHHQNASNAPPSLLRAPGSATTDSLQSKFASLPQYLLHQIFARLDLEHKLGCIIVCSSWRTALSCMPRCTWGPLTVSVIGHNSRSPLWPSDTRSGLLRRSGHATQVVLVKSDLLYEERGTTFVNWLSQRVTGICSIDIVLAIATDKTGWVLPHLLLSLTSGAWRLPDHPPIHLKTGKHAVVELRMA